MIGGVIFDPENHVFEHPDHKRRIPSVTDVLKFNGWIKNWGNDESAMMRGRAVHLAIKFIEKGTLDWKSVDPIIEPFLKAYQSFKKETEAVTFLSEQIVWHPLLQYAGILDWFGVIDNSLGVIDYKTGSMQEWTKYQVVGYRDCIDQESLKQLIPHDRTRLLPFKRWGLELKANGRYNLQPYTSPNDSRLFQAMVALTWEKLNTNHTTWRDLKNGKRDNDNRLDRSAEVQNGRNDADRAGQNGGSGDHGHPNLTTRRGHDVGGKATHQNN